MVPEILGCDENFRGSREVTKLHEELPNPSNVGLDRGRAAKRQELPVEY